MSSSYTSIAYLKIFALGLAAVAHGFVGGTSAFAQQSGQPDFSTQYEEYSEEEYLREIEELEALYDQYLAEEGNDEIAIFPEDGAFGRNVPDPIRGQTSEIFITPTEQDALAETILTEQPTPEVEFVEEEIIELADEALETSTPKLLIVEEVASEPVQETVEVASPDPTQEIVVVEEADVEEDAARESETAETTIEEPAPAAPIELAAPVSGEPVAEEVVESTPVAGLVEEILETPATENLAAESSVFGEVVVEEIISEPTLGIAEGTDASPEPVQEIVVVEEADVEEDAARESETAETTIEEPAPAAPIELAAPVSGEPVAEEVAEEVSPEPTLEVAEETEAVPEPAPEIAEVEETDIEEETVRESEVAETAIEEPAPIPIAPVELAAPVSEEPVAEEIVEEVSPEPTLEVAEETEAAPEPAQEIV
ncbi:MAG: hypothetical protein OXF24_01600, partial [Hyphomicrobiales bacterium]|nr:hypothetical protein [Hyphomicrobiales bacterium]